MTTIAQRQKEALQQELLTVEQFSLLTQYHIQSIYRLIAKGKVAVVRIGGYSIRIPRSEARAVRARHPNADQSLSL